MKSLPVLSLFSLSLALLQFSPAAHANVSMAEFLHELETAERTEAAASAPDVVLAVEAYNAETDQIEKRHYKLILEVGYSLTRLQNERREGDAEVLPIRVRFEAIDGGVHIETIEAHVMAGVVNDSNSGMSAKLLGVTSHRLSDLILSKVTNLPFKQITSLSIIGLEAAGSLPLGSVEGMPVKIYGQATASFALPELTSSAAAGIRVGKATLQASTAYRDSAHWQMSFRRVDNELSLNYQITKGAFVSLYAKNETVKLDPNKTPPTENGETELSERSAGVRLVMRW